MNIKILINDRNNIIKPLANSAKGRLSARGMLPLPRLQRSLTLARTSRPTASGRAAHDTGRLNAGTPAPLPA